MLSAGRIDIPPPAAAIARYRADDAPCFMVFVDTEEEFDWRAPFRRDGHGTGHVRAIPAMQKVLEDAGIVPTYLVDTPIAESDEAVEILRPVLERGACAIGTQLHPWVAPPFEEVLTRHNSFAGNLPASLERAKIAQLTRTIAGRFGVSPSIYRAGRYGVGPHSAEILEELGYRLDVSVRAGFAYGDEGGPDFTGFGPEPFWAGPRGTLLALPLTSGYPATLHSMRRVLDRMTARNALLRGLMARTGLFVRIPLTPEGVSVEEAQEAIRALAGEGCMVFSLSFHSPSLEPGHTAYVRDAAELKAFYRWWDAVIDLFTRLGVRASGASDFVDAMVTNRHTMP